MIDAATCNATHHAGCGQTPPTVKVGNGPDGVAVDPATDTVYVTIDGATGTSHDLSVINGATCNAHRHSGCGQIPATVNVGVNPGMPVVDQANGTVYVPSFAGNTVSVLNAATCNGTDHAGCHQTPPVVPVGTNPFGAALDQATHTIYVGNSGGNTLSMINGATCNGTHQRAAAAPRRPRRCRARSAPPHTFLCRSGGPGHRHGLCGQLERLLCQRL